MRRLILAAVAAFLAAQPAGAAPIISDGGVTGGVAGSLVPGSSLSGVLAARRALESMAERFARTGTYGDVVAAAEALLQALPGDALALHLVAAARAAQGQTQAARETLGTATGEDDVWRAVAEALIARRDGALDAAAARAAEAIALAPGNAYAHNVAGTVAVAQGDLVAATSHFGAAVARAPEGAPYFANLGAVLVEQRNTALARLALDRALELAPGDCTSLLAKGRLLLIEADPAGAAAAFGACLDGAPAQAAAAAAGLAEAQIASRAFVGAAHTVETHPGAFPAPELTLAVIALHAADPAAARRHLDRAGPAGAATILPALAEGLAGEHRTAAALAAARARAGLAAGWPVHAGFAAAAGEPADPQAPRDTAAAALFAALAAPGDPDALPHLLAAAGVLPGLRFEGATPDDLRAVGGDAARQGLATGSVLELTGFAAPAEAAYATAAAAAPGAALPKLFLARSLIGRDRAGAEAAAREALALSPNLWLGHRILGDALARRGAFAEATAHFAAAADAFADADTLLMLGAAAEQVPDDRTSRDAYERLLAVAPDSHVALNQFAWFLANRTDELDRADALAQRANAIQPGNASVLDTLGWIAYRRGDVGGALERLREAFAIDAGRRPEIGLRLARVAIEAGQREEAATVLRRIDEAAGGTAEGPEVDEIRRLLGG